MAQAPKRIPGERNPTPNRDAPMHVARESWMGGGGHSLLGYEITRAVLAFLDRRKARKARTRR